MFTRSNVTSSNPWYLREYDFFVCFVLGFLTKCGGSPVSYFVLTFFIKWVAWKRITVNMPHMFRMEWHFTHVHLHLRTPGWRLVGHTRVSSDCVTVIQVCHREGWAGHARQALRPPGLSRHRRALDEAARLLPEAEIDQQPPGPVRTRRCL